MLPLLQEHPSCTVHACDFSPKAVELTRQRAQEQGLADRLHVFVRDVTKEALTPDVPAHSCDAVTLVFCLSAMSPEAQARAVLHCAAVLAQPHGVVCVRDYAAGDLAEQRLEAKSQKLGDNFYVRSDGTRAYYFTQEVLTALFATAGLECRSIKVCEKEIVNRAKQLNMERRWIQAEFVWPNSTDAEYPTEVDGVTAVGGDLAGLYCNPAAITPDWTDIPLRADLARFLSPNFVPPSASRHRRFQTRIQRNSLGKRQTRQRTVCRLVRGAHGLSVGRCRHGATQPKRLHA